MKTTSRLVISASLFLFFSCAQGSKDQSAETSIENSSVAPAQSSPAQTSPAAAQPSDTNTIATPAPQAASGVTLNPAHGQPGHRCDIPVGQPLNTAVAQPTQAIPTAPDMGPLRTETTPVAPAAKPLAVRFNPAHGQPGHDCAIPVGAPLKN